MGLILERSGMARTPRHHRPALWPGGAGLCGDLRRGDPGGDHRRGGGLGDLDGPDLAAHHDALRLRSALARVTRRPGTLAQIIPPSLVLIIMADQLGRSVVGDVPGRADPRPGLTAFYVGRRGLIAIFAGAGWRCRPRRAPCVVASCCWGRHQPAAAADADLPVLGTSSWARDADRRRCDGAFALGDGDGASASTTERYPAQAGRRSTAKLTTFVVMILIGRGSSSDLLRASKATCG